MGHNTLPITAAIQGTSCDKIFEELELESHKARRLYKHLSCMFKIVKEEAPNYLMNLIPKRNLTIRTRNSDIPIFRRRADCFKYSFFPTTLRDWFNLDDNIRNSESISIFKNRLFFFLPWAKQRFKYFRPKRIKSFDLVTYIILKTSKILYVSVVWKLKIPCLTYCTAIVLINIVFIL